MGKEITQKYKSIFKCFAKGKDYLRMIQKKNIIREKIDLNAYN